MSCYVRMYLTFAFGERQVTASRVIMLNVT